MRLIRINKVVGNRVLQHTLFWLVSYYILLKLFASSGQIEKIDYIYTALFHLNLIFGVYFNLYILIPKLLTWEKFFFYILSLLIIIAASAELNILFFDKLVDHVLPGYYFISYYEFADVLKYVVVYLAISSLIKLAKSWFELLDASRKITELQKEKSESELKALKGQINPHFLFNSLNVLYSLALKKSDESANAIIQLSDILRYVIYNSNKEYVSLSEEIELINDYLSLQKFRIDADSEVEFNVDVKDKNLKIAPMFFLPLVENSFKHGLKGDIDKTYINIQLYADQYGLRFEIENNKGISEPEDKDYNSCIGLSNIKNRLNLMYPDKHTFEISEDNHYFRVKLIINYENQLYYSR